MTSTVGLITERHRERGVVHKAKALNADPPPSIAGGKSNEEIIGWSLTLAANKRDLRTSTIKAVQERHFWDVEHANVPCPSGPHPKRGGGAYIIIQIFRYRPHASCYSLLSAKRGRVSGTARREGT